MTAYTNARQAYAEASVMTATPERLVVLLYDGALRFLRQSAAAMQAGRLEEARSGMRRGEAIIDELNVSLDMEQGELADRLRSIYVFCKRHLVEATLRSDAEPIEEVCRLLADLRVAWDAVAAQAVASV